MKILLTGASGFIGGYILEELKKTNHELFCISRQNRVEKYWIEADLLKENDINNILNRVRPDVLLHFAWDVEHDVFWNSEKNYSYKNASIYLIDQFLKYGGKKILAAGTCAEYACSNYMIKEDNNQKRSLSIYGQCKREVFEHLYKENQIQKFDYTWFRIFGLYGPGENRNRFFPTAINNLINGTSFSINDPERLVDYVYVKDLANLVVNSLSSNTYYGAINIGTGKPISIKELFTDLMLTYHGKKVNNRSNKVILDESSLVPDCCKLHKSFGVLLRESGFEETINYYKGNNG